MDTGTHTRVGGAGRGAGRRSGEGRGDGGEAARVCSCAMLHWCCTQVVDVSPHTPTAPDASVHEVEPAVVQSVRVPVQRPAVVSPKFSSHSTRSGTQTLSSVLEHVPNAPVLSAQANDDELVLQPRSDGPRPTSVCDREPTQ